MAATHSTEVWEYVASSAEDLAYAVSSSQTVDEGTADIGLLSSSYSALSSAVAAAASSTKLDHVFSAAAVAAASSSSSSSAAAAAADATSALGQQMAVSGYHLMLQTQDARTLDTHVRMEYATNLSTVTHADLVAGLYNLTQDVNRTLGNWTGSDEEVPISLLRDISLGVVLGFLSMLTFVGNAMVLHAVRTEKRLQTVSNMFIVSLAIADLIVGLIVMPISATYIFTKDWIFGLVVCQFWIGVDYTASTASILNLFILSLDRYWSVTSPLKYLRKRTKKRAMIMISFVWVMSSLWLIPIIGWHHFEHDGVRTVPSNVCDTEYATNIVLKILTAILNFYLPLAIMFGLYTKIFLEIRKRSNLELGQHNIGGSNHYRSTHPSNTIPMTSSLTDDSNKSNEDEDEEDGEGDDAGTSTRYSPYSTMVEREQFIPGGVERGGGGSLRSTTEYETETGSDDDMRRLHRGGYTNLTLVQAANRLNNTTTTTTSGSDVPTSDNEVRIEYFYDETVVDSTTEKVHRFYDEHALPILRTGSSRTAETSLNSPNIPNRPQSSSFHWPKPKALVTYTNGTKGGRNGNPVVQHKSSFKIKSNKGKRRRRGSTVPGLIDFRRSAKNKHALEAALRRQARNALRQHDKRAKGGDKAVKKKPSAALAREIKAAKQLGVIMGAFTVCFCPYFVLFMVVAFCDGCISPGLMIAMTWVGYLNSTLNPFLYPLCNITFRRKFRCMLGLSRHRATDSPKSFATNSRYVMQQRSINGYPGGKR